MSRERGDSNYVVRPKSGQNEKQVCRKEQVEQLELREPGEGDGARYAIGWERGGQTKQDHCTFECVSRNNAKPLKSLIQRVTCSDL